MVITFSKEYTFEGKKYNEIELDLENITGQDLINYKNTYRKNTQNRVDNVLARNIATMTMDTDFLLILASDRSNPKVPLEFFTSLPAKDFMKVMNELSAFFTD